MLSLFKGEKKMLAKDEINLEIKKTGIMAIVRVETTDRAKEIAQACLDGGINVLEISYTNSNAGKIIEFLKDEFKEKLLVGAGTVLDSETARSAILSKAEFIIAPTMNKEVALLANRYQVPYMPGCVSMTEMVEALEYGASFVKIFPVAEYFGPSFIKTVKTPTPYMPLLSSGGVNLDNAQEWFESGVEILGIGSLLTKGSYDDIFGNAKTLTQIKNEVRSKY